MHITGAGISLIFSLLPLPQGDDTDDSINIFTNYTKFVTTICHLNVGLNTLVYLVLISIQNIYVHVLIFKIFNLLKAAFQGFC